MLQHMRAERCELKISAATRVNTLNLPIYTSVGKQGLHLHCLPYPQHQHSPSSSLSSKQKNQPWPSLLVLWSLPWYRTLEVLPNLRFLRYMLPKIQVHSSPHLITRTMSRQLLGKCLPWPPARIDYADVFKMVRTGTRIEAPHSWRSLNIWISW